MTEKIRPLTLKDMKKQREFNEKLLHEHSKSPSRRGLEQLTLGISKKLTPKRRKIYTEILARHGEPARAWVAAGVEKQTIDSLMKKDPTFILECEDAMEAYRAWISGMIELRGMDGVEKPIYHNGQLVGWTVEFSDRLAEMHAKRHIPEYRDKVTVTNEHSGGVSLLSDLSKLPKVVREELRGLLEKIKVINEGQQVEEAEEKG